MYVRLPRSTSAAAALRVTPPSTPPHAALHTSPRRRLCMDGGEPPPVHGCSEAAAGPSGALALIHAVPTAGATALGASGPTGGLEGAAMPAGVPGREVMAAGAPGG